METGITLQINLAPSDLPHAVHILPHQLQRWRGQIDEVLFTVDLHRSTGRFATAWEERLPGFILLIHDFQTMYPGIRVCEVDYGAETQTRISRQFFEQESIPAKDYIGDHPGMWSLHPQTAWQRKIGHLQLIYQHFTRVPQPNLESRVLL